MLPSTIQMEEIPNQKKYSKLGIKIIKIKKYITYQQFFFIIAKR